MSRPRLVPDVSTRTRWGDPAPHPPRTGRGPRPPQKPPPGKERNSRNINTREENPKNRRSLLKNRFYINPSKSKTHPTGNRPSQILDHWYCHMGSQKVGIAFWSPGNEKDEKLLENPYVHKGFGNAMRRARGEKEGQRAFSGMGGAPQDFEAPAPHRRHGAARLSPPAVWRG